VVFSTSAGNRAFRFSRSCRENRASDSWAAPRPQGRSPRFPTSRPRCALPLTLPASGGRSRRRALALRRTHPPTNAKRRSTRGAQFAARTERSLMPRRRLDAGISTASLALRQSKRIRRRPRLGRFACSFRAGSLCRLCRRARHVANSARVRLSRHRWQRLLWRERFPRKGGATKRGVKPSLCRCMASGRCRSVRAPRPSARGAVNVLVHVGHQFDVVLMS